MLNRRPVRELAAWSLLAIACGATAPSPGSAAPGAAAPGSAALHGDAVRHSVFRVNGVRIDVVALPLSGEAQRIAAALAREWTAAGSAPARLHAIRGGWLVGRQRGPLHETVELRAAGWPGAVEARIAIVDLSASPPAAVALPLRLPAGLRRVQVVEELSAPGQPVVFVLSSRVALEPTWQRLNDALAAAGLSAESHVVSPAGARGAMRVFSARGARATLDGVVRNARGGARVVLISRTPGQGVRSGMP